MNNNRDKIIIGNPNSIRDFTHVKDTVNAYILVSESKKFNEPFNVCSGKGITIADYATLAKKLFNIDAEIYIDPKRLRPSEVPLLIGRNDKIRELTGWAPTRSVLDIIREGVKYFQDHPEQLGIEAH